MKRCVYTVLTGGYEPLNEQIMAHSSALPFICFTDDPDTVCEGWEIRPLARVFPADDIRNQRAYKLQPHLVLPEFDQSLYIDNSVQLRIEPERIFDTADLTTGMSLPRHSYRACLADEFEKIVEDGLDDPRRVAQQLEHYRQAYPEVLAGPVCWSGLMLRDHQAPKVHAAMAFWLAHVYRYSRRDQLSSAVAFHMAGLQPEIMTIDNYESSFHTWPHLAGRKAERRLWQDGVPEKLATQRQIDALQQAHDAAQLEGIALREELQRMQENRDALREELQRMQEHRDALQAELPRLLQHRDALAQELPRMSKHRDALQQAYDRLQAEHSKLQQSHEVLLNSTSWRVTAPIRAVASKFFGRRPGF